MTRLGQYLQKHHLSHRAFAAQAGFPALYPMVSLWARGKARPGIDLVFRIEEATGGEVPAAYWQTVRPSGRKASRHGQKLNHSQRGRDRR